METPTEGQDRVLTNYDSLVLKVVTTLVQWYSLINFSQNLTTTATTITTTTTTPTTTMTTTTTTTTTSTTILFRCHLYFSLYSAAVNCILFNLHISTIVQCLHSQMFYCTFTYRTSTVGLS